MFFKKKKKVNNDRFENEHKYLINLVNNISDATYDVTIEDDTSGGKIHFTQKTGDLRAYIAYTYGSSSAGCSKIVTIVTESGEIKLLFDANFLQSTTDEQYLSHNQKMELNNLINTEIQYKIQKIEEDCIKLECDI